MDPVGQILLAGAIGLIAIGIAGVVLARHLFRIVLALVIAEAGANLLLVLAGFRGDAIAPIILGEATGRTMVDPVPQAMVLTAIVIGVGVQALALGIVIKIKERFGTLDLGQVRERLQQELDAAAGVKAPVSQEQPAGERPLPPPGTRPVEVER